VRAGLRPNLLQSLGTSCEELTKRGHCFTQLGTLFPSGAVAAAGAPVAAIVANFSCPESCGLCPRGDGFHRPPEPVSMPGRIGRNPTDWTCSAGPPQPARSRTSWEGERHTFVFTCPDADAQIGGAAEHAATWSHRTFAQRQRTWLERELQGSTADWKIVIGHCE
jgi:hypothetical protein